MSARVGEWSVYVGGHGAACLPQLFVLRCFYCFLLLPLSNKNANNMRDFIQVMQQRSARGNFLVVSGVGR